MAAKKNTKTKEPKAKAKPKAKVKPNAAKKNTKIATGASGKPHKKDMKKVRKGKTKGKANLRKAKAKSHTRKAMSYREETRKLKPGQVGKTQRTEKKSGRKYKAAKDKQGRVYKWYTDAAGKAARAGKGKGAKKTAGKTERTPHGIHHVTAHKIVAQLKEHMPKERLQVPHIQHALRKAKGKSAKALRALGKARKLDPKATKILHAITHHGHKAGILTARQRMMAMKKAGMGM